MVCWLLCWLGYWFDCFADDLVCWVVRFVIWLFLLFYVALMGLVFSVCGF